MARRKKKSRFGLVVKLALLLALVGGGYWLWLQYEQRGWRPDETAYPDQGALVGEGDGAVDFEVLKGLGAGFVYLEASRGARGKDANFSRNLEAAREAGLQVGAVHLFDPCETADGQSANYVTIVPRDAELLPPAIRLTRTADQCFERVSEAAVQSELLTLVNQIESHTEAPVVLAPGEEFERRYRPARRLERALWLDGDMTEPDYGGRPWTVWTANSAYASEAAEKPLRWLVVRP
ncbi:glycoside hydrolase family 25 protein [Qipengyuania gelatinilytica]|uniref:Glycoside hydrolase family 25 protein n=1 Tax=Qipengyuania gelatinilytica TaxID=2867231 RepID=A0ABX9AAV8_9SPHN|nr:glycoside hydrolase family 25 protein [Qipengyuania gelatinilytica]QZD96333.1 glycoside hydrolase family 25 protein [Qipengyuania gelatinilytica]